MILLKEYIKKFKEKMIVRVGDYVNSQWAKAGFRLILHFFLSNCYLLSIYKKPLLSKKKILNDGKDKKVNSYYY